MNREIKFRAWLKEHETMITQSDFGDATMVSNGDGFGIVIESNWEKQDAFNIMQFTGLKDKRNQRDVFEGDIYFEEDAHDDGDRRIYFVITWINERCAFSMLEVSEYQSYISNGFDAIERDFDGFYFEITQNSIDRMHHTGNIYQNPKLLSPHSPSIG